MTVARKRWDGSTWVGSSGSGGGGGGTVAHDWSATNLPWAYTSEQDWLDNFPTGYTVVPLMTGGADFWTDLTNTVNAASGRVVVQLEEGVYSFSSFRMIGSSGDPTYAFGFWSTKLAGFLGRGPDKTFIQMDADSMTQEQLDKMKTMDATTFITLQMGLIRLDPASGSPVLIGGLTFRAADQQDLTSIVSSGNLSGVYVPQPAPHKGVNLYDPNGYGAYISHVRFQAAGRAINSAPPFECSNIDSNSSNVQAFNCEVDGRRSPDLDPAQPRRCGVVMGNGERSYIWTDTWFHHSNISRYAVNDENTTRQGVYTVTRCKAEQITNNQNRDPALNGGNSLGGYTNATPFGWESCAGTITLNDPIINQDNPNYSGQVPCHLQLTSVGSRNPQGGRMHVHGGTFHNNGFPTLEGFLTMRIATNTYWYLDGYSNTIFAYAPDGTRLTPHQYTGSWPPTASYISSNGLKPTTHYIVRSA